MARYFIIPMQAPANGTGIGTRADPWRPKYLVELGLPCSIRNGRDFCLAEVWGEDRLMEELAAKPDVVELPDTDEALPANIRGKIASAVRGMPLVTGETGRACLGFLRRAIHDKQNAERPQSVSDAVRSTLRAGN